MWSTSLPPSCAGPWTGPSPNDALSRRGSRKKTDHNIISEMVSQLRHPQKQAVAAALTSLGNRSGGRDAPAARVDLGGGDPCGGVENATVARSTAAEKEAADDQRVICARKRAPDDSSAWVLRVTGRDAYTIAPVDEEVTVADIDQVRPNQVPSPGQGRHDRGRATTENDAYGQTPNATGNIGPVRGSRSLGAGAWYGGVAEAQGLSPLTGSDDGAKPPSPPPSPPPTPPTPRSMKPSMSMMKIALGVKQMASARPLPGHSRPGAPLPVPWLMGTNIRQMISGTLRHLRRRNGRSPRLHRHLG